MTAILAAILELPIGIAYRKLYLAIIGPIHLKSWPNMKLGRYYLLQFGFIYP